MIVLNTTSDLIEVVTDSANALDVLFSFVDTTTTATVSGRQRTAFAAATTQTVVSSPSAGIERVVKHATICARGGANNVIVRWTTGSAAQMLGGSSGVALNAGDTLVYTDTDGWRINTPTAAIKHVVSSGGGGGGVAISAAGNSISAGTAVWSNSNNVSFGMAGSTITASVTVATSLTNINLSAGTTSNLLSAFTLANGGGVSFGLDAGTVTASIATSLTAVNLSAGTTSNNLSAFVFSNSNNVSFGLNGSTVTASASVATSLTNINVSAGTTSQNLSALVFSNANGVTFGLNGSTVTASAAGGGGGGVTISGYNPFRQAEWMTGTVGNSSLFIQPLDVPAFSFDRLLFPCSVAITTGTQTGTRNITMSNWLGIYTRTSNSLSLLSSTSVTVSATFRTNSSASLIGMRCVSCPWSSSLNAGRYWFGMIRATSTSGQAAGTLNISSMVRTFTSASFSGQWNVGTNATDQMELGLGRYSAQTAALPGSIHFSQIQGNSSLFLRQPVFHFELSTF